MDINMKDTALYKRLSDNIGFRSLLTFIRKVEPELAMEAYLNITRDASDHPRYNSIVSAYNERFGATHK